MKGDGNDSAVKAAYVRTRVAQLIAKFEEQQIRQKEQPNASGAEGYSEVIASQPTLGAGAIAPDQSRVQKSPLIKAGVVAVGLLAIATIFWAMLSLGTLKNRPSTPSLNDYFVQSTTGSSDLGYDAAGAREAGLSDKTIADYLAEKPNSNVAEARRAGYSDGQIVDFIAANASTPSSAAYFGSGQTVIAREPLPPSAPSVHENIKRETEALTKVYPYWRDIVGRVDAKGKFDPKNEFRVWLGKQPEAYQRTINDSNNASVIIAAIDKFRSDKAKAAAPSLPAAP